MVYEPIQLTQEQIHRFEEDGFLVLEKLIDADQVTQLVDRLDPLFSGQFETGIYPDEWHWRPGLSLPNATRQICNAWKSDLTIASVALSAEIARLSATLAGWRGARIGQDSLWVKPSGAKEVSLHQDATYIGYLNPPEMLTCWIALDNTSAEAGTIEYVPGSHRWPLSQQMVEFHAPNQDYRASMRVAATEFGISTPDIILVEIPAGGCVFHHGRVWHGSGKNTSPDRVRRSLSVHLLSAETQFQPTGAGYIYGRYQRSGSTHMDEDFFPILWTQDGHRTPFLANYCKDALAASPLLNVSGATA
ncbi:phytanoyl-CoA dioxygenase family protein [Leptolyngbya sp. FACHB-261]|uniref:phytanoyl-CoA dioxygenase family protein n=1 Tax=Leptolyngbya sp. FACHB-261 TaxID=2692806 RepID=UPI001687C331|nr:phytanoyl-CoA dioxygenase family protein [Leptolyngbya sp. FACHB-261]MBD2102649.1 phytanoyl-CoA dioxygenase family protein [Leptolyngbya sp. FACHB-261]